MENVTFDTWRITFYHMSFKEARTRSSDTIRVGQNNEENSWTIRYFFLTMKRHARRLIRHVSMVGRENEPLDIEMLSELQQTVVRADRVLSNPDDRSLLLIGRSGVGRHTTIRLLSVMHHAQVMTPYPGRNYGRKQFINDLKLVKIYKFRNHANHLNLM